MELFEHREGQYAFIRLIVVPIISSYRKRNGGENNSSSPNDLVFDLPKKYREILPNVKAPKHSVNFPFFLLIQYLSANGRFPFAPKNETDKPAKNSVRTDALIPTRIAVLKPHVTQFVVGSRSGAAGRDLRAHLINFQLKRLRLRRVSGNAGRAQG
ncbi:hypothetical protein Trydic_g9054 [Trypoxylus dichotomus]